MNYIIEDNLDFKAALASDLTEEQSICLISQQPLTKTLTLSKTSMGRAVFKGLMKGST